MSGPPHGGRHGGRPSPPPEPGGPAQGHGSYGPPPPYQGPPPTQQRPARPQQQPPPPAQQQPAQWQQPQQQAPQQQYPQEYQGQQDWAEPEPAYYEGGGYGGYDEGPPPLASIPRRAAARLIDNTLVAAFGFALILPIVVGTIGLGQSGTDTEESGGVWNWPIIFTLFAVLSVLPFLYEAVQLAMYGRTLGKRLMHVGVVQARPAGTSITATQGVYRAGIIHVGYQLGVFFFLSLAVMVWDYLAYGMLLVWIGVLMAYLWAIWDQPLHQALHDRFSGTLVIDERVAYDDGAH